ncbi:recombinase family protein [Coleofasciculus sp. FACHB-1120]|uniref:recombinase family protein n=1 Tax=Coleofasciculus sp. FACHB-1120 TaxID=2692783 RepID=UPI001689ED97|nr:recombinase family protein [Coleofasciculus sp. FACHB-1120]MBD2744591.1 recombinase family protein [Coleofasciculus sp. FACHB-1120]
MLTQSQTIWIDGPTRSGKTTRLVNLFCQWVERGSQPRGSRRKAGRREQAPTILVFAANDDNRSELADRLARATQGRYPIQSKTPLGFFQDEVILFWPLLIQRLNLRAQFPVRLRPETEQELATRLWRPELDNGNLQFLGVSESRSVRRILDLLQLCAIAGRPLEEIPSLLEQGFADQQGFARDDDPVVERPDWEKIGTVLIDWRQWCLDRGLLTYGIICELYWRYLLPDEAYQQHLIRRYQGVLADNVDDYPAIACDLFNFLLDQGAAGAFTYNPDGAVRLGLNADPNYLASLEWRCQVETLSQEPSSVAALYGKPVVEAVSDPMFLLTLPESVQLIQTPSRAQLLRETALAIAEAIHSGQVQPQDVAVIAPGLDAIARYTLIEILSSQDIPVQTLSEQRPLNASPTIRALLTLLALVYPGLGRLVDRDAVAEMLVVLSQESGVRSPEPGGSTHSSPIVHPSSFKIDPVRAGLLADYCYSPDPEQPRLLPVTYFPRWDRLGHSACAAYEEILQWLEVQRDQLEQRLIPNCVALLDRAIQQFLWKGSNLPYDQLAALRELMETAQHYWEVDGRLRQSDRIETPDYTTIDRFICLLRRGTVTANPYPVRPLGLDRHAVTLATIFQYRAARRFHRWQFWLDAGSHLWSKGGAATLYGAPLFLKDWSGEALTEEDTQEADEQRLRRILLDLLGRAGERIYLCHSELATNGQEQTGPLLSLVNASIPLNPDYAFS